MNQPKGRVGILVVGCVLGFGSASVVHDFLRDPVVQLATARHVHVTGSYGQKSGPDYDVDGTLSPGGFDGRGNEALPTDNTIKLAIVVATWWRDSSGPITFVPSDQFSRIDTSRTGSFAGVDRDGRIVDLDLRDSHSDIQLKLSE